MFPLEILIYLCTIYMKEKIASLENKCEFLNKFQENAIKRLKFLETIREFFFWVFGPSGN